VQEKGTRKEDLVVEVIERTEGRYDTYEVEFGTVYRWCPECVVVECDCGERPTLTASMTICSGCGADHVAAVQELNTRQLTDETVHPWRYDAEREEQREGVNDELLAFSVVE
jgi:hypothetical protein